MEEMRLFKLLIRQPGATLVMTDILPDRYVLRPPIPQYRFAYWDHRP